jgi:hypothetical protein
MGVWVLRRECSKRVPLFKEGDALQCVLVPLPCQGRSLQEAEVLSALQRVPLG